MENKKKKEFPNVLVILMALIIICTLLTYVIPAGTYEQIKNEATGRMVIDPASFKYVDKTPVGLFGMLLSVEEGLIAAASISFMIFMAFSSLFTIEKTGAIDAIINSMTKKIKDKPKSANLMIAITMAVISAWGSTGTLSYEEIIAFVPIFVTLSIALGYDALVGLGMSFVAVGIGFASSTINPFTVGVAQGIAELPLFTGLRYRIIILVVMTAMTIAFVLMYANKIKKNPSKSLVADVDYSEFVLSAERAETIMTKERILTLIALLIAVIIMAYGLIEKGWYINEVAAIFIGLTLATGIINKWSPNKLAGIFIEGLSKGVLSALVVGFARGVLVVLAKGQIIHTIVHAFAEALANMSLYVSSIGMLIFQTLLNFLIPSGSGQAAVSMPIVTPIADLIGMNRQIAALIFQFGDGYSNLLWPTGFLLIGCAIGKIPINKYYKWFIPYFLVSFVVQVIFIFIAIAINFGPF